MKIGVDASCWSNRRGFGRFTRELLTSLAAIDHRNDYWFFADQQTAESCVFPSNVNFVGVKTQVAPTEAASAAGRRSLRDVQAMSNAVYKHSLDLFFFPAIYSYFPIFNRTKVAVTIHDMTPTRFARSVFPNRKLQLFWNLKERLALWQADRIITVSEYSKKQIIDLRGVKSSRISIVTEGPGSAFRVLPDSPERTNVLSRFGIHSDSFLLYVGGISPHKNLSLLARVFQALVQESSFADLKLVFAGDFEKDSFYSDYSALSASLENLTHQGRVIFTGYVEDEDLAHLYNAATLFVFPSHQEGFGLPAVEAMACGTPVIASKAGSLPEIIGDAGIFFDPNDFQAALAVIRCALLDPSLREDLRQRGLERAKHYTWERAAEQLLQVFDGMN